MSFDLNPCPWREISCLTHILIRLCLWLQQCRREGGRHQSLSSPLFTFHFLPFHFSSTSNAAMPRLQMTSILGNATSPRIPILTILFHQHEEEDPLRRERGVSPCNPNNANCPQSTVDTHSRKGMLQWLSFLYPCSLWTQFEDKGLCFYPASSQALFAWIWADQIYVVGTATFM